MNYSQNSNHVRVDFFKESGKWYETLEIPWLDGYWYGKVLLHDALLRSVHAKVGMRNPSFSIVCLDPYHQHAHPIMIHNWGEKARELGLS